MESIQLYLNSNIADKYFDNNIANAEYILPLIEIPDGFHIYLSVVNCQIPYSFYNINSSNNKLIYQLFQIVNNVESYFTAVTITIPEGNYSIKSLITSLKTLSSNFTLSYSTTSNKLKFTHSTYNFIFSSLSTCLTILGFSGSSLKSSSLSLTSDICVNIITVKSIQVQSNLITYNINKSILNIYNILCNIPINNIPFSMISYNNYNHFKTNLFVNQICCIKIKLTDEFGNLLNLNGCHYSITLQLDVEQFT